MIIETTHLTAPARVQAIAIAEELNPATVLWQDSKSAGENHRRAAAGIAEACGLTLRTVSGVIPSVGPYRYVWETTDEPQGAAATYANNARGRQFPISDTLAASADAISRMEQLVFQQAIDAGAILADGYGQDL